MVRKALRVLVPVGVALLAASQWADIRRYLKIKQLSVRGPPGERPGGRPEGVPAKPRRRGGGRHW